VERVKKLLLAKNYDAAAIKAIEKSVKKEVDAAVEESKVREPASSDGPPEWGLADRCCFTLMFLK